MTLIDTLHINNGRGEILLNNLITESIKKKYFFFLLDKRCEKVYDFLEKDKVIFLNASLKNKNKFSTIFCFGHIPPLIKTKAKIYTYLHQLLFVTDISYLAPKLNY